ncbi:MAG: S8 family serine peptidase [Saprospiraceae bacterium]|nr:S8 family serine peptidase [Saprospiraceae bacterium]
MSMWMIHKFFILLVFLFILRSVYGHEYNPNQIIIKYKSTPTVNPNSLTFSSRSSVNPYTAKKIYEANPNLFLLEGENISERLDEFNDNPDIVYAEPNFYRYPYNITVSKLLPNDSRISSQWALDFIEFHKAWALSKNPDPNNPIIIGVVDSEFDISNPDLENQIWTNSEELLNGIDDDQNGYVDDIHGYDFGTYPNGSQVSSLNANDDHGTHVAGISVAEKDNNLGIVGIQPFSKFIGCKISDNNNFTDAEGNVVFSDSAIINAFEYLVDLKNRGENIVAINASFGGPGYSQSMYESIIRMRDAGIILCTASGNEGIDVDSNSDNYPNNYNANNILAVAALNQSDSLAGYSNYGLVNVDLAAPGSNIISSLPTTNSSNRLVEIEIDGLSFSNPEIIEFSGVSGSEGVSGSVVYCGLGYPNEIPPQVDGNIALIQRGELYFSEKVNNAMQAGAIAVIIFNNTSETSNLRSWTLQSDRNPPWIPSFSVSQIEGNEILSILPARANVKYYFPISENSWGVLGGTSMATPFVTGAVAFAALNFPNESVSERRNRIMQAVDKKNYLENKVYSGGSLNLRKIIDLNNDYIPDWWDSSTNFILPELSNIEMDNLGILSFDFLGHNNRSFSFEYTDSLETNDWNDVNSSFLGEGYTMKAVVNLPREEALQYKNVYYRLKLIENN